MNEEWKNETPKKKIERLELVKDRLGSEVKMLIEEIKQEKEKNKKLEEEVKEFSDSYARAEIEECDTYFMLNRIINLMAEDLKKNVDVLFDTNKNIKDIKEYYFKKAKENKDVTKNIG